MISNIQLLRFFAAILVVAYHLVPRGGIDGEGLQAGVVAVINMIGYAGVDIFFVISGFIMWVTTARREGGRDAVNFFVKRYTRIYSGYWPFFLLMWAFLAIAQPGQLEQREVLSSGLLVNINWETNVLMVAWTLVFELYFYSIFTLLVWAFSPSRRIWASVAILASIVLVQIVVLPSGVADPLIGKVPVGFLASWYCAEFFLGVVAGWIYSGSHLSVRPTMPVVAWLAAGLLIGGAVWYQWAVLSDPFGEADLGTRIAFFGVAGMSLVLALAWSEKMGHPRFHRLFEALGGASYSIYLSHLLIIGLIGVVIHSFGFEPSQKLEKVVILTLVIGYSLFHYHWVERPLLKLCYAGLSRVGLVRSAASYSGLVLQKVPAPPNT